MSGNDDPHINPNPPELKQYSALEGHVGDPDETVILPDDAGPHAAALETILRRIPPRWGRWIDTGPGWYPLIVDTDTRLAALDPDYVIHQIKEKYGTLRYYCAPSDDDPTPDPDLLDAFDTITDAAEHASGIICEQCGEPGAPLRTQHWAATRCASCAETAS